MERAGQDGTPKAVMPLARSYGVSPVAIYRTTARASWPVLGSVDLHATLSRVVIALIERARKQAGVALRLIAASAVIIR